MKRLAILRHAEAGWPDGIEDFDRPLTHRGKAAARQVGAELKQRRVGFDLVLASSARRVCETLAAVGDTFGQFPVRFDYELYLASEKLLLQRVRELPETVGSAIIVGHDPGLGRLVADLAEDDERGLRMMVIDGLPTAAVAILDLSVKRWGDVERGGARFVDLILPRGFD